MPVPETIFDLCQFPRSKSLPRPKVVIEANAILVTLWIFTSPLRLCSVGYLHLDEVLVPHGRQPHQRNSIQDNLEVLGSFKFPTSAFRGIPIEGFDPWRYTIFWRRWRITIDTVQLHARFAHRPLRLNSKRCKLATLREAWEGKSSRRASRATLSNES